MTPTFQSQLLPGRTMLGTDGTEYLYFGGTDYLGMGRNEDFLAYLTEGIRLGGTHFGSSRNNSLQLTFYDQAEIALARYTNAPAVLIVSSGMWAGQLVMKTISQIVGMQESNESIRYHYAPRVHPALWGNDLSLLGTEWDEWADGLAVALKESPGACHIVCTDAVGSPWVEGFNLKKLAGANTEKLWLVVDDSHGLGVRGSGGGGCFSDLKAEMKQGHLIVVSSLNKALGVPGGAIMADKSVLDVLRLSPWFAGASPPPPAYMHALTQMVESGGFRNANAILKNNIAYFDGVTHESLHFASILHYPVYCSREMQLYPHLLAHGIMSSCFSYPAPTDAPVTRLAINALHTKKDLDRLAEVCMKF
jgi:8-amino-7-oxononanoate synthase